MSTLILKRSGQIVEHNGAKAGRGTVTIGSSTWHTIERLEGYKWLRAGDYSATFAEWTSSSGAKSKAIRITGIYQDRIYFHPANYPAQLKGCIAPGKVSNASGVGSSRAALMEMFTALGGYNPGAQLKLSVKGSLYPKSSVTELLDPGELGDLKHEEIPAEMLIS